MRGIQVAEFVSISYRAITGKDRLLRLLAGTITDLKYLLLFLRLVLK
jgi:hypothetical protein